MHKLLVLLRYTKRSLPPAIRRCYCAQGYVGR